MFATFFSDPEGNPLVYSVSSTDATFVFMNPDDNSEVSEVADGDGIYGLYVDCGSGLSAGTYHLTIRATDPSGLYVDQTFTITVTP